MLDGTPRPDHGPGWRACVCTTCKASWVGHKADSNWCPWCEATQARRRAAERLLLLDPPWLHSSTGTPRYDALDPGDKAVWDRTRGQHRGTHSLPWWVGRLRRAVEAGDITEIEAEQAIRKVAPMDQGFTYEQLKAMYDAAGAFANGHTEPAGEWQSPTPLVDWVEAYGIGDDPAHWLAEPLLPDAGSVAIFARGGTGKSLLALWLAAGLATGQGLVGRATPIEVLYLDYEMTLNTVVERLEDMGYTDPAELDRLHYASLPSLAPLDTAEGGRAVVDMAGHLKAGLVVIDTFGRAVDGEEDRADTVRAWYRWTGQLLKTAGIGFLRIDHAGKDVKRGQRGTSAKNDDVDVVWEMTEHGRGEFLLRATKRRVSWVDERIVLTQTRDNGVLAYHWADNAVTYLTGTKDVAAQLDELGAPVDISRRKAMALLRRAGQGRDNNVVGDALRYRREALNTTPQYHSSAGSGEGSDTASPDTASPQVIPPAYQSIPAAGPNPDRTHTYVVGAVWGGDPPPGLFDPSTDPEVNP